MIRTASLRVVLAAMLVALHLGGFGAAAPPERASGTVTYFCCCAGECHCTGDCCNHPPEPGVGSRRLSLGPGDATARWESPRTCGGMQVVLTPGPRQHDPALPSVRGPRHAVAGPVGSHRSEAPEARSDDALRAAGPPRAPPA